MSSIWVAPRRVGSGVKVFSRLFRVGRAVGLSQGLPLLTFEAGRSAEGPLGSPGGLYAVASAQGSEDQHQEGPRGAQGSSSERRCGDAGSRWGRGIATRGTAHARHGPSPPRILTRAREVGAVALFSNKGEAQTHRSRLGCGARTQASIASPPPLH